MMVAEMILVDMNQVTLSNLMVQIGGRKEIEPDLVRHMVLNSLRGYRSRFSDEYGELVLCYDDKTNWRRDVFPNYKHGRRKDGYRGAEGKVVELPHKGPADATVVEILGGVRSAATYIGAKRLKDMPKCATFVRCTHQVNQVFNKFNAS